MASFSHQIVTMSTQKTPANICLQPLMFSPLAADGTNFLEWVNDAKMALATKELFVFLSKDIAEGRPDVLK